jgi:hypothetical protein
MDWKKKLTSRKFWSAVINFVTMLIIALKGTEQLATQIAALIMAGAGVVAYIIGEGLADAAAVEQTYVIPQAGPYFGEESEDDDAESD